MKKSYFIFTFLLYLLISGCTAQKFTIDTAGYSSWKGDKMLVRRKAILLNTETGETWGLAYNKNNSTRDGYAWEKLPNKTQDLITNEYVQTERKTACAP